MTFVTYKEKLKGFSKKIVEVQKPIRILNSIRVPPEWEAELLKNKFKALPKDPRSYYEAHALGFDPVQKTDELKALKNEIATSLGADDEMGLHLQRICED